MRREKFEREFHYVFQDYKYGSTIWSPLCQGILSGKYNDGSTPEGSRFEKDGNGATFQRYFGPGKKESTVKMLNDLAELAKENGCTQAQLALAWAIANKDTSVALLGFTKIEQIHENLKAVEVYQRWSHDLEAKCDAILANQPEQEFDYPKYAMIENRRKTQLFTAKKQ